MEEKKMGMFKVRAKVANPADPKRFFEEEFWVDTGSTYTFIPEDRLQAIGIEPLQSREVVLANGQRERRLLGSALLTLPDLNETLPSLVMFGSKQSPYIVGRLTLDTFGAEPDPAKRTLAQIPVIIASQHGSPRGEAYVEELHGEIHKA